MHDHRLPQSHFAVPVRAAVSTGLVALAAAASACGGGHVPLPDLGPVAGADHAALVARGEYIVRNVSVCGHCHAADPRRNVDGPLSGGWRSATGGWARRAPRT